MKEYDPSRSDHYRGYTKWSVLEDTILFWWAEHVTYITKNLAWSDWNIEPPFSQDESLNGVVCSTDGKKKSEDKLFFIVFLYSGWADVLFPSKKLYR